MDLHVVFRFLGKISFIQAVAVVLPCMMALYYEEDSAAAFGATAVIAFSIAGICRTYSKVRHKAVTIREGIAITGIGWLTACVLGMLPYVLGGYAGILDGLFESISGFTGTGATVIENVEILPQSILFWRSMTQWLGGLGIVVIFIALLPESGQSTLSMYNAEAAGPTKERVLPRLRNMMKVLFILYAVFTSAAFVLFWISGMEVMHALNHALSAVSAGGFSTYNAGIAHFDNAAIEVWITFFMILAGGNFGLYYQAYQKGIAYLIRNTEFKVYACMLAAAAILITLDLIGALGGEWETALRYAVFQTASSATAGFVLEDYDTWPAFSKCLLLVLMLIGGCSGSTAAGIKVVRIIILVKSIRHAVHQKIYPNIIRHTTINGKSVSEDMVVRVNQFFFLYIFFIVLWTVLLVWDGINIFDAFGISISAMGCIGPAFGMAGPACTYAGLSDFSKTILCFAMLLGRLEIMTVLVMCRPGFWKTFGRW